MSNVWAHDVMERMRLRRKIEARHMGLGDIDVGTFPSHPPNVVINEGGGRNSLTSFLLAGLLSAGVGGMGTYAMLADNLVTAGVSSVTDAPKETATEFGPIDLEIEVIGGKDGPVIKSVEVVDAPE